MDIGERGKIVDVCRKEHQWFATPVHEVEVGEYGFVVFSHEVLERLRQNLVACDGFHLATGRMGETLIVSGIGDPGNFPPGTQLIVGGRVIVEVSIYRRTWDDDSIAQRIHPQLPRLLRDGKKEGQYFDAYVTVVEGIGEKIFPGLPVTILRVGNLDTHKEKIFHKGPIVSPV